MLVLSAAVGELGQIVYAITNVTLRQRIVPGRLLGRVNATMRSLLMGLFPLGGTLGTLVGPRLTLLVATGLIAVSWLPAYYAISREDVIPGETRGEDGERKVFHRHTDTLTTED